MKRSTKSNIVVLLILLQTFTCWGQQKKCCNTYVYEGYILKEQKEKLGIHLNFLMLLDSTMVGSYNYDQSADGSKLVGKLSPDFSFELVARNSADSITGFFIGNLNTDFTAAYGKWQTDNRENEFDFEIKQVIGKSYWDYIKKNRALFEYKNVKKAIKGKNKVLSIDLSSQELSKLPNRLSRLNKVVSINLLGNQFKSFPTVLSKLTTLDEISLSSNQMVVLGPQIGKLKNLRILIVNNNQLKGLPKEIGELTNLLYLDIGNNKLTGLPDEIKYLTNLQELHVERNLFNETEKQKIKNLLPNCIIHF